MDLKVMIAFVFLLNLPGIRGDPRSNEDEDNQENGNWTATQHELQDDDDDITKLVDAVARAAVPAVRLATKYLTPAVDKEVQIVLNATHLEPVYKAINESRELVEAKIEEINKTSEIAKNDGQYTRSIITVMYADFKQVRDSISDITDQISSLNHAVRYIQTDVQGLKHEQNQTNEKLGNLTTVVGSLGQEMGNLTNMTKQIWGWIQQHNKTSIIDNSIKKFDD